jgi:Arp2/3 complex, 34 kD subunit p34-Arc
MRHRVAEFLKVLNRAKPEAEKERKTVTCVEREKLVCFGKSAMTAAYISHLCALGINRGRTFVRG